MHLIKTALLACALSVTPLAMAHAQAAPLNHSQVRAIAVNMGYTPKDLNGDPAKPKFEIATEAGSFTVPLGIEVSSSGRYIWISANLGPAPTDPAKSVALLKRIAAVQPTHFWITSNGKLFCGMAIENRDVTPVMMRFAIDKIGADIASSVADWQE